jgi:FkbM family methyltransferase
LNLLLDFRFRRTAELSIIALLRRMKGALTGLINPRASLARPIASPNSEGSADRPALPIGEAEIYRGYSDADAELLRRYARSGEPAKGFVVDFVGSRTRIGYVRGIEHLDGAVGGVPIPGDGFHAEAIEWVGLLKSVEHAGNSFTAMELGAGWGPWVVAGACAARQRGIGDVKLCAVEADPEHFRSLVEHFRDNGLNPSEHDLIRAAVGVAAGTARWPKVPDASADWGSRPQLAHEASSTDHVGRQFAEWLEIPVVPFGELLRKQPVWDLVHIDVQGWEVELCEAETALLESSVKWLVIGTHDYKLHGDLMDLMFRRGWLLENEKPPRFSWTAGAPSLISMTTHDGTQVWRNPRFMARD